MGLWLAVESFWLGCRTELSRVSIGVGFKSATVFKVFHDRVRCGGGRLTWGSKNLPFYGFYPLIKGSYPTILWALGSQESPECLNEPR